MLTRIDRYILRRELVAFAAVLLLVSAMLTIENAPRIWSAVSLTSSPVWLFGRMLLALLPEYVAIGILVASFLAPAWVIRSLALRGEWTVLSTFRIGPRRAMLAPMFLAAAAAGCQLTLGLGLEPYGERVFDGLCVALDHGAFGLPLNFGEFVRLDNRTSVLLSRSPRADRQFGTVFLRRDGDVYTAASANAYRDATGRIEVELHDGRRIGADEAGHDRVLDFKILRFAFRPQGAAERIVPTRGELGRIPLGRLVGEARREMAAGAGTRPATASLMARITGGLFCLQLPWLAYVLARPPLRERGGGGLVVGIGVLVLFLRTNSLVEAHFTHWPVVSATVHFVLWIGAVAGLVRFAESHDEGAVDHVLNLGWSKTVRAVARFRALLASFEAPAGPVRSVRNSRRTNSRSDRPS